MSELSRQFRDARNEYERTKYPGDLGTDLLGAHSLRLGYANAPRRNWARWAGLGLAAAFAASVALVIWINPGTVAPAAKEIAFVAVQPRDPDAFSVVPEPAGSGALAAKNIEIVPIAQSMTVPAIPSFQSLSSTSEAETQSNQEKL